MCACLHLKGRISLNNHTERVSSRQLAAAAAPGAQRAWLWAIPASCHTHRWSPRWSQQAHVAACHAPTAL
jgi:hypothetical protein